MLEYFDLVTEKNPVISPQTGSIALWTWVTDICIQDTTSVRYTIVKIIDNYLVCNGMIIAESSAPIIALEAENPRTGVALLSSGETIYFSLHEGKFLFRNRTNCVGKSQERFTCVHIGSRGFQPL